MAVIPSNLLSDERKLQNDLKKSASVRAQPLISNTSKSVLEKKNVEEIFLDRIYRELNILSNQKKIKLFRQLMRKFQKKFYLF